MGCGGELCLGANVLARIGDGWHVVVRLAEKHWNAVRNLKIHEKAVVCRFITDSASGTRRRPDGRRPGARKRLAFWIAMENLFALLLFNAAYYTKFLLSIGSFG